MQHASSIDQLKHKYVFLCAIAVRIRDYGEKPNHPRLFRFLKDSWLIKEEFAEDAQRLKDVITRDYEEPQRKVCFIPMEVNPESNRVELFVASMKSNAKTNEVEHELSCSIFPIIFKDYYLDLEQHIGFRENDHLELVYITNEIFTALHKKHEAKTDFSAIELTLPECFQPKLRRYQERSIKWLLMRETVEHKLKFENIYQLLICRHGSKVYKDKDSLTFYEDDSLFSKDMVLPPGGILADEMGLGKTVEILALILLNPRTNYNNNINSISDQLFEIEYGAEQATKRARMPVTDNFLCFCSSKSENNVVQCCKCQTWQHTKCVANHCSTPDVVPHLCPQCWPELLGENLVESAATFIVTPHTIQMQWVNEIKKHVNSNLRIHCYKGIGVKNYIDPFHLAQYDIVLTEYNILRREIYHTDEYKSDRESRHKPRFLKTKSPLLQINWWRVCLDEAQMVESNTSNAAELAHMLPAINRWAVTGTPIQQTIHDLYPLLNFLNFNTLCEPKSSWDTKVNGYVLKFAKEPLIDVLHQSMWRTCKSNVQSELEIPQQNEIVHRFNLSNIESLHYQIQHKENFKKFLLNLRKYLGTKSDTLMANISPTLLKLILQPLLKIRQCCSIPVIQAVCGESREHFLKPNDLLEHMKNKVELECKKLLRRRVSSLNGLGGVHCLRGEYNIAANKYQHVLGIAKKYHGDAISVDTLLQIHALHNLIEINDYTTPTILSAETCNQYKEMEHALDWQYRTASREALKTTRIAYQASQTKYMELQKLTQSNLLQFISELIEKSYDIGDGLFKKIQDDCISQGFNDEKLRELKSMQGVLYIIDVWYKKVKETLANLNKMFNKIKFFTEEAIESEEKFRPMQEKINKFVTTISNCHLDWEIQDFLIGLIPKFVKKGNCELCTLFKVIKEFECLLITNKLKDDSNLLCLEIFIIKIIFNYLKSKPRFTEISEQFNLHLESIECLQSICKKQVKFWIEIDFSVKAFDELDMCKTRITVTDKAEEITNYVIIQDSVEAVYNYCIIDVGITKTQFNRNIGRLKYIRTLCNNLRPEDVNCPICEEDEIDHYVVLHCGHIICYYCISRLVTASQINNPTCPICRSCWPVYYSLRFPSENKPMMGDFSTKITWVVGAALTLLEEDPSVKILIFSRWVPILKEIAAALKTNGVTFRAQCTPKTIEEFKDPSLNISCMLMPFSRGSKGLNLIEATHVFLVEPILNPSEELQAIGRVHRFGQTKSTTVHRFIANDTIEENLYNFIIGSSGSYEENEDEASSSDVNGAVTSSSDGNEEVPKTPNHWELGRMSCKTLRKLFKLKKPDAFYSTQ